jgi:hypothetical protein
MLMPGNCGYVALYDKQNSSGVIKVMNLDTGAHLDSPGGLNLITRIFKSGETFPDSDMSHERDSTWYCSH